jgi:hypothetical protein
MSTRDQMAWYVCGPMTRIPRFNYPMFHTVALWLRQIPDRNVISPHELDSAEMQTLAWASPDGEPNSLADKTGETWGDVLARDVRLIEKQIGHFALLPNWQQSRGARLEVFVGLLCGVTDFGQIWFDNNGGITLETLSVDEIRELIRRNMP